MLKSLKEAVYEANMELPKRHLVTYTWGNVSGISREKGLVVIKPSGVEYDELTPDKLVVLDLDGNIVEGKLNPSSDTKTHLELYKQYPDIGGIVHTHSPYAVGWAPGVRGHSLLRHDPRGLLLRRNSLRAPPDDRGNRRGLREEHRQSHHRGADEAEYQPGACAGDYLRVARAVHMGQGRGTGGLPRRCAGGSGENGGVHAAD